MAQRLSAPHCKIFHKISQSSLHSPLLHTSRPHTSICSSCLVGGDHCCWHTYYLFRQGRLSETVVEITAECSKMIILVHKQLKKSTFTGSLDTLMTMPLVSTAFYWPNWIGLYFLFSLMKSCCCVQMLRLHLYRQKEHWVSSESVVCDYFQTHSFTFSTKCFHGTASVQVAHLSLWIMKPFVFCDDSSGFDAPYLQLI